MKYLLVCPDCGESDFCRIYENITLFEEIDPEFNNTDSEFDTRYFIERQVNSESREIIRCNRCEFEVEYRFNNKAEATDKKLMELLIEEKCALEVV